MARSVEVGRNLIHYMPSLFSFSCGPNRAVPSRAVRLDVPGRRAPAAAEPSRPGRASPSPSPKPSQLPVSAVRVQPAVQPAADCVKCRSECRIASAPLSRRAGRVLAVPRTRRWTAWCCVYLSVVCHCFGRVGLSAAILR